MFPPNSPKTFTAITQHDEYHINGGDLFFLVEHVQFRVHRYFFERESALFRGILATPAQPGVARQGTSDSNAIVLENVKAKDFSKFLWVFYNPKYSLYNTTVEDWTTILDLAHRWAFPEVKNLAVRELEKLNVGDVERISTYHKYEVDRNLLIPRYAALCERENPLDIQEGILLGMETSIMIARAREIARVKQTPNGLRSPTVAGMPDNEMRKLICDLFHIPGPSEPVTSTQQPNGTTIPAPDAPPAPPNGASNTASRSATAVTTNGTSTANGTASTNGASKDQTRPAALAPTPSDPVAEPSTQTVPNKQESSGANSGTATATTTASDNATSPHITRTGTPVNGTQDNEQKDSKHWPRGGARGKGRGN